MPQEVKRIPCRIEQVIRYGSIDDLKDIIKQIQLNKGVFKTVAESRPEVPNLVILACRYDKIEILKYLLKNDGEVLSQIDTTSTILPNNTDKWQHNAFYYAIRSGNIELLNTLITEWPDSLLSCNNFELLDDILSKAYEEIKLKNILLSDEMQIFVESQLIDISFMSNETQIINKEPSQSPLSNIKECISFLVEIIALLNEELSANDHEISERFFFLVKCIAKNIYVLKRQLKSTYTILPWEEIEFCLLCFISSHKTQHEVNIFYHSTLNKTKLLKYLNLFAEKLHEVGTTHLQTVNIRKIAQLPNINRPTVVANILDVSPQFEELYNDYQQIRDIHSLTKISEYIKLSMDIDPKQREGQLVITRTLQILGEYCKNTLESPKLSKTTNDLLLFSLSNKTNKIITDLRNSLTHASSLSQRTNIEKNNDVNFFVGIQQDCKKLGSLIADILHTKKINLISALLKEIMNINCSKRIREMSKALMHSFNLNDIEVDNFRSENHEKIEKLFAKFRTVIPMPTNYETEMFQVVDDLIMIEKMDNAKSRELYISACSAFKMFHMWLEDNSNFVNVKEIKHVVSKITDNISQILEEAFKYKSILCYASLIFESCKSRMQNDVEKLNEINTIISDIQFIACYGTNDVKFIKKLDQKISEQFTSIKKDGQKSNFTLTNERYKDELKHKLHELRNELEKNLDSKHIAKNHESYKCNKKLQAVVEVLLLDILTILGVSKICVLENNFLSFRERTPLLTGKSLRNHLAHDNILVDLLLTDPSISIVLNANKLITENIITDGRRIGKVLREDLEKIRNTFKRGLMIIENQKRMLMALQNGNFIDFKCLLENGTDIYARCSSMRTTLHYAAMGGSLEIVEFLCSQNVPADARDIDSKTALHIAAEHGRTNVVEYFLSKQLNSVDEQTKQNETSLHLAAANGHNKTVESLLKHRASTSKRNLFDLVPLQKAVLHKHKEVVEVFLKNAGNVEVVNKLNLLHFAAKTGSLDVVSYLIEKKANVNPNFLMSGKTPLHLAAQHGHTTIVNLLIENKAKVNFKNKNGCAALHFAAENGYDEILNSLLKHHANINAVDADKCTPLHYAIKNKQEHIVDICLNNGANADLRTSNGRTALHYAIISGNINIINNLLRRGVNTNGKDQNGLTPLHLLSGLECACKKEIAELLLLNRAQINAKNNSNCTPLHLASLAGNIDVIELLVANGANINVLDNNNETPLHKAARKDKIDAIKILVKSKAVVNAKDKKGLTPLYNAASNGCSDIVEYLLKNNAKENKDGNLICAAINIAITFGHFDVVKVLLQHRAKINDSGIVDGSTLFFAVTVGNINIVKILIENGANVNPKNMGDKTPLCCAIKLNRLEIVKLLVLNGANVDGEIGEPIYNAIFDGHIDIVEYLLTNKARLITKLSGIHLLHIAVSRGHKEIVSTLIRYGADVNSVDVNNPDINKTFSPLHLAVLLGNNEIIKILLENGANVNQNSINGTPLHLAVFKNDLECVKLMLKTGKAKIDSKSTNDSTILHVAAENGFLELVKYLVDIGCDINARNLSHGSKAIHVAAGNGFKNVVEFFHKTGLSVDETNSLNQTLLHCASKAGHLEVVKYLIAKNAYVNAQDLCGLTPLHCAANHRRTNIVELLLHNGAMYNAMTADNKIALDVTDSSKITSLLMSTANLFEAVKEMNCTNVKKSLKTGAIVNSKDNKGFTPLYYASHKGFVDLVRILLKNNANPNTVDMNRFTPLHYALKMSHFDIVKMLLVNGAYYDASKDKPIRSLDSISHKDIVDLLQQAKTPNQQMNNMNIGKEKRSAVMPPANCDIKSGPIEIEFTDGDQIRLVKHIHNLSIKQYNMRTAVTNGNAKKLQELIANGSSVNEAGFTDGRSPLHYAVHNENTHIVNILLANGANVAHKTNKGNTPLHTAVSKNNKEIVDILLRHAKISELREIINAKTTTSGSTALHVAATKKYSLDIVKLLLKYGAAYDVTNQKGEIPFQLSNDEHVKSLLKLIGELFNYVTCENLKVINILKTLDNEEFSIATNSRNNEGATLLQTAIVHQNKSIANQLIEIIKIRN